MYQPDIILAQKIFALCNRKRAKGRDIYDIVYLYSLAQPNWEFLKKNLNISGQQDLVNKLSSLFSDHELNLLAADVEPFLIKPQKIIQIKKFNQWLKSI